MTSARDAAQAIIIGGGPAGAASAWALASTQPQEGMSLPSYGMRHTGMWVSSTSVYAREALSGAHQ